MGNCASSSQEVEGKARSDLIDRQIEEDSKRYKRECKILLLGASPTPPFFFFSFFGKGRFPLFHRANGGSLSDRATHVDGGRQRDSSYFARHGTIVYHNTIACPPNRTPCLPSINIESPFPISAYGHAPHFQSSSLSPCHVGRRVCDANICSSYLFSLGSGESGKSTIVKQMKIIHQNGYSHDELIAFRPLIWKNLLECARDIVQALRKFNLEPITPANKVGRSVNLLFCIPYLLYSVFHRQIVIVS